MHGEKRNKKDHKLIRLKQASNKQKLTIAKDPEKQKKSIINFKIPPADYLIRKFILNPVEGSN